MIISTASHAATTARVDPAFRNLAHATLSAFLWGQATHLNASMWACGSRRVATRSTALAT